VFRVAEARGAERRAHGFALDLAPRRSEEAAITRQAMRRALVALGVLTIKTRRVSPTLKSISAA